MFNDIKNLAESHVKSRIDQSKSSISVAGNYQDLAMGGSFNPEYEIFETSSRTPIEVLEYARQDLRMKHIRLSIYWENVVKTDGSIDLSYYREYLDYCVQNGIELTLNIGPIKVMRWPEVHIPLDLTSLLAKNSKLTPDHPVANTALEYLNNLCSLLKRTYGSNIKIIQADNELFNAFGSHNVKITSEFEIEVIKTIIRHFPNTQILMSSSGRNDLRKIYNLLTQLKTQGIDISKFIIGINYYYKIPATFLLPIISGLDGIAIHKPGAMSISELKTVVQTNGQIVEVSEFQLEEWKQVKSPGRNYQELLFALNRVMDFKPESQKQLVVRAWGIEQISLALLDRDIYGDELKIRELIRKINENLG